MVAALFSFDAALLCILLFICTCTYLRPHVGFIQANKHGFSSVFYKATVIGDRLSPVVSIGCVIMAFRVLSA